MEKLLDMPRVHTAYVDIGAEICATPCGSSGLHNDSCTFLWRTCCLESLYQLLKERFNGYEGTRTIYPIGYLEEVSCMTVTPTVSSSAFKAGFIYMQAYSSVKEVIDAQGKYPFARERLTELAIDPRVHQAYVTKAKVSHARGRNIVAADYQNSKERVFQAYRDAEATSYGVRIEFRCSWELLQAIMRLAAEEERKISLPPLLPSPPPWVISVPTPVFTNFMAGNLWKLTTAIEVAIATSPVAGISLGTSKVLSILLQCLQTFQNCDLNRYTALSGDIERKNDVEFFGMGIRDNMARHGYGWFKPIVNWQNFSFAVELNSQLLGPDHTLLKFYEQGSRLIRDSHSQLMQCIQEIYKLDTLEHVAQEVGKLMAHIVYREFRRDIIDALESSKELFPHIKSTREKDDIRFCSEGMGLAFKPDMRCLVAGNRLSEKDPSDLFDWIFGYRHQDKREFFKNKSFVQLYLKALEATRSRGLLFGEWWRNMFKTEFFEYHWVVPYPKDGCLIGTQKDTGLRMWYSTQRVKGRRIWGKSNTDRGFPDPYPASLDMDEADLLSYFADLRTNGREVQGI
jgi:hypothetical protein